MILRTAGLWVKVVGGNRIAILGSVVWVVVESLLARALSTHSLFINFKLADLPLIQQSQIYTPFGRRLLH